MIAKLFFISLLLTACEPRALRDARAAAASGDYTTALALYEKLCAENPKELLWRVEFDAAVRALAHEVTTDTRPDEGASHAQFEALVAELLRRKDVEAASDALFERARLNLANHHYAESASYLLRAADVVPHSDKRELYERQALHVLDDQAPTKDALPVSAAQVAAFPKSARWCGLNASLVAKSDAFDRAIAEYTRCQELDPDNFDNQLKFGAEIAALEAYKKRAAK